MKKYIGCRNVKNDLMEVVVEQERKRGYSMRSIEPYPLPWRLDLANHSPTGLSWGYGGSGPSQCALAILADCLGDERALRYYHDFKWKVIAQLPMDEPFELTEIQVRAAVAKIVLDKGAVYAAQTAIRV